MAGGMPREAAHSQLASALDVVIHLGRPRGRRRVEEIAVLRRGSAGYVESTPAVTFGPDGEVRTHEGADRLGDLLCR